MPATPMSSAALKELHDRKADVISRRPSFARAAGQACLHMAEGLACDIHHEDCMVRVDHPEAEGGTGTGPDPGQLMLASLAASLASGYRVWAARRGLRIDSVDIEIACEYDLRGAMGLTADVAVGWERVWFHVAIVSPEPEAAVRDLVEQADRLSPMLANLAPSVARSHRLTVIAPRSTAQKGGTGRSPVGHAWEVSERTYEQVKRTAKKEPS